MDLVIRRARPADKRQVLEAVRTIWGGHDRVPAVFDRWVTHRSFLAVNSNCRQGMYVDSRRPGPNVRWTSIALDRIPSVMSL